VFQIMCFVLLLPVFMRYLHLMSNNKDLLTYCFAYLQTCIQLTD